jgi:hypothetical protein
VKLPVLRSFAGVTTSLPASFTPGKSNMLTANRTHADGIIGNIEIGKAGKTDIQVSNRATHLTAVEAKLFSKLAH